MLLFENLRVALQELWANKFRSTLTTLGIIIAVSSIIAVVAIINGASSYITTEIQSFGPNQIWVHGERPPGREGERMGRIELTYEDALAVQQHCSAVESVAPLTFGGGAIQFRGEEESVQILGGTPEFQVVRNFFVDQGRYFSRLEVDSRQDVIVVGREVARKLDAEPEEMLGQTLWLSGRRFLVAGFFEEKGSFLGSSQDDFVMIPITTAAKLLGPRATRNIFMIIQAKSAEETKEAVSQITRLLRRRHDIKGDDPDDFTVQTQDQFLEVFNKITFIFTAILGGIVSISLLVGGIGIMNIMLVSVTERTREIGIRKAVGARGSDVLWQFLIEAVALSLVGGLMGIVLGMLIAKGAAVGISFLLPLPARVYVPIWAILVSVGFAGGVGVISGFYPAFKASRLDPIEALRHE